MDSGNKEKVRAEMGVLLKMLRTRAHGINEIAADELFNHWVMVTPIRVWDAEPRSVIGSSDT